MAQIMVLPDREEVLHHIQKVQRSFHIKAPDLPSYYPWLNVERPLTATDLRGKVVLLDFWAYGRINCLHVIPDLKFLEQKYTGRPFAVIGVHSAKFTNERDLENIRQAVLRHGIDHPVIVDQGFALWQSYGVHTWPTLVLVDPDGKIQTVFTGEGNRDAVDLYVEVLLEQYEMTGRLNPGPLPVKSEKQPAPDSVLLYPGKVLIDPERKWLFIADTGHHRVLAADLTGKIIHVVGAGQAGFSDGDFKTAQFSGPQGMALYKNNLLAADTGNHAVRQIDFISRQVRTIAGTGQQGHYFQAAGHGPQIPLSSPWDLQVIGSKCYIAMAGAHQIWVLDLERLHVEPYAGTSQEARVDGPRKKAAFAQPSGITADPEGRFLFVADSEVSAVRAIDFQRGGAVSTLVGGDLFDFGDEDGHAESVRLQHPLGIQYANGKLYLADTYNHKIKIIHPENQTVRSFLGAGKPGYKDGSAPQFYEPGGITALRNFLYVADTNNHRIRVVNLQTHEAKTLELTVGPGDKSGIPVSKIIHERPYRVSANGFILRVHLLLPFNRQFTPASPLRYRLTGNETVFSAPSLNQIYSPPAGPVRQFEIPVTVTTTEGQFSLALQLQYFYCDKTPSGTCKTRTVEHQIPLEIHHTGQTEITIEDNPK